MVTITALVRQAAASPAAAADMGKQAIEQATAAATALAHAQGAAERARDLAIAANSGDPRAVRALQALSTAADAAGVNLDILLQALGDLERVAW